MFKKKLTIRVQEDTVTFKVFKKIKSPFESEDYCNINVVHPNAKKPKDIEIFNLHIHKKALSIVEKEIRRRH